MRNAMVQYALVVLTTLVLVGCRSSESSVQTPTWSMSKLNPFSKAKSPDDVGYPARPSSLAAPSVTPSPGAGYADATSTVPGNYANVAPGYRPYPGTSSGTQYAYPSAGSLAGASASANPAAMPQSGSYDAGPSYSVAGQSGSVPSNQSSGDTSAPRYGVVADRYGLNRGPSQPTTDPSAGYGPAATYPAMPSHNSQATTSQGTLAPYQSATSPDYSPRPDSSYGRDSNVSVADSRYDTGSPYGPDARSLVGDRYAPQETQAAGFNSYKNGQLGNSASDASWNPGQTSYAPGQSDYQPGNTGYEPGNTGYQPAGTSPYRSPAEPYSSAPFLPGSTKSYAPRTTDGSLTPQESFSNPQVQPKTDTQVIPAGNPPLWPTRTF